MSTKVNLSPIPAAALQIPERQERRGFIPRPVPLNFVEKLTAKVRRIDPQIVMTIKSCAELSQEQIEQAIPEVKSAITEYISRGGDLLLRPLQTVFSQVEPKTLSKVIRETLDEALREGRGEIVEEVAKLLSVQQVQSLMEGSIQGKMDEVALMIPEPTSSIFLEKVKVELYQIMSHLLYFVPNMINTVLSAFRLLDLGKDPDYAWDANAMLDIYIKLFAIPTAIVAVVQGVLGVAWYAWLIAAAFIIFGTAAVYVYVRWLKPCPEALTHCENLVKEVRLGRLSEVVGRGQEVDYLLHHFSDQTAQHVLLVGPSRVGKTAIVNGLAHRIVQGNVPHQMRNKKIFMIKTGRLAQQGMSGFADMLDKIFERIRQHENEVILFFEEAHAALKIQGVADYLKPLLDRQNVQCIATTTEYEGNGTDPFFRRFRKMDVESISKSDTKMFLYSLIQKELNLLFEPNVVDKIYELTKERPRPWKAKTLLENVVCHMRKGQTHLSSERELQAKEGELKELKARYTTSLGETGSLSRNVVSLSQEISVLKGELEQRKSYVKEVKSILQLRGKIKKRFYKSVRSGDMQQFVLYMQYMLPLVDAFLKEKEAELGKDFPFRVTEEIVNQVWEHETTHSPRQHRVNRN